MSKGGARYGAGRPGYKVKAEHLCRVDVREWARRGYLRGACAFSWSWQRGGEPAGSIGVCVHGPDALTLAYTATVGDVRRDVTERLTMVNTPCAYGGARPWFKCPCCARRVAMLYLRGGRFACRLCKRVAYSSQSDDALDRLWRRQDKIEKRLAPHWQRPKGMRHHTYARLWAGLMDCEARRDDALALFVQRLNSI
jgi:hypothetical protein